MGVQFDANFPTVSVLVDFPAPVGTQDITEYVLEAQTWNGRRDEAAQFDASASFLLENWDGRFTAGLTSGPYVSGGVSFVRPKVGVRVTATWSSVTYNLWRGRAVAFVDDWRAQAIEGFDSQTVLQCEGLYSLLAAWVGAPVAPVGADEMTGARFGRILTALGYPHASSIAPGTTPLAATDLSGSGVAQLLEVVDSEGGAFYIEGDGTIVFEDRGSLLRETRSNTSQVTFSAGSVFVRDVMPDSGDNQIVNRVSMTRDGGVEQLVEDSGSQAVYGPMSWKRTGLPVESDVWVAGTAGYNLARWKTPFPRIKSVTMDPVQAPALMWPHALGRRIHDRATVSLVNSRSGVTFAHGAFIEGTEHRFSQNAWSTTFALSSAEPWGAFAGAGVWDSSVWDTAKWFF